MSETPKFEMQLTARAGRVNGEKLEYCNVFFGWVVSEDQVLFIIENREHTVAIVKLDMQKEAGYFMDKELLPGMRAMVMKQLKHGLVSFYGMFMNVEVNGQNYALTFQPADGPTL